MLSSILPRSDALLPCCPWPFTYQVYLTRRPVSAPLSHDTQGQRFYRSMLSRDAPSLNKVQWFPSHGSLAYLHHRGSSQLSRHRQYHMLVRTHIRIPITKHGVGSMQIKLVCLGHDCRFVPRLITSDPIGRHRTLARIPRPGAAYDYRRARRRGLLRCLARAPLGCVR